VRHSNGRYRIEVHPNAWAALLAKTH